MPSTTTDRRRTKRKARSGKVDRFVIFEFEHSRALRIVALVSIAVTVSWLLLVLFAPGPEYRLRRGIDADVRSPEFIRQLEAMAGSKAAHASSIEMLPNGENFYRAEMDAARRARRSINIEAYIFHKGDVTRDLLPILAERAAQGVAVNLVVDAVGSASTAKRYFQPLLAAGGHVEWFHPVRLTTWLHSNNRTHRELTLIDGQIAFVGGAGYADQWREATREPRWRDSMFMLKGDVVSALEGVFAASWVESSEEILSGAEYFSAPAAEGSIPAIIINSTPSQGGATRARMVFQTFLAGAKKSVYISTPYFLPDRSARQEVIDAVRQRHVAVKVLVPGSHNDHALTRSASRNSYGDLLANGVEIYEYQPTMIHAKILVVDQAWVVIGSTNFDHRSFGINDEISVAVLDPALAAQVEQQFRSDLASSRRVTYQEWRGRPAYEHVLEWLGWLLKRQE
jgi:cardiolipin synthase A/B